MSEINISTKLGDQDNQPVLTKKNCAGHCPACGASADDCDWTSSLFVSLFNFDKDNERSQPATCRKCGCLFNEKYRYVETKYQEPVKIERMTCMICGRKVIPAGISNQIDGRRYHGLWELADDEWVVCPNCYKQNPEIGDWNKNDG